MLDSQQGCQDVTSYQWFRTNASHNLQYVQFRHTAEGSSWWHHQWLAFLSLPSYYISIWRYDSWLCNRQRMRSFTNYCL